MKNIFSFFKNNSKSIPQKVKKSLSANFPNAINIEWNNLDNTFEAIFYLEETELIAKFSGVGNILELKKNLWLNEVPDHICLKANEYGEMMSAISIKAGQEVKFEIIIRKKDFARFLLLFNQDGILISNTLVEF